MWELTIQDHISSAHYLRQYEGKCKNFHGHNWKIEIAVTGTELDEVGMIADFGILKTEMTEMLSEMDHVCLNDLEYFKTVNTTSENIAKYLYDQYTKRIAPLNVKSVRVWESEKCSVIFYSS